VAMGKPLHIVGKHGLDGLAVGGADHGDLAQAPLALGGLLGQDVALIGLAVKDFFSRP
jgi:hypothetical protein